MSTDVLKNVSKNENLNTLKTMYLGFAKITYDFIAELHRRFPKKNRLRLMTQRFFEFHVKNYGYSYNIFKKYFLECERKRPGTMYNEYSEESRRVLIENLPFNTILTLIKFENIWTDKVDNHTNRGIWSYLQRMYKTIQVVEKTKDQIHLLDPVINEIWDKVEQGEGLTPDKLSNHMRNLEISIYDNYTAFEPAEKMLQQEKTRFGQANRNNNNNNDDNGIDPVDDGKQCETRVNDQISNIAKVEFRLCDEARVSEIEFEDEDDNVCGICFERKPNVRLNCGHEEVCEICIRQHVQNPDAGCPFCRAPIAIVFCYKKN